MARVCLFCGHGFYCVFSFCPFTFSFYCFIIMLFFTFFLLNDLLYCWLDYFHLFLSDLASIFFSNPPSPPFLVNDSDSDVFLPETSGKVCLPCSSERSWNLFFFQTAPDINRFSFSFFFLHGIYLYIRVFFFHFILTKPWSAFYFTCDSCCLW